MELCPKCGKMTAERNHYTKLLICHNRECFFREDEKPIPKEEKKLRELLWFNHGCPISCLYGDDGEMQCNNGQSHRPIDFKRDTPQEIEDKLHPDIKTMREILSNYFKGENK